MSSLVLVNWQSCNDKSVVNNYFQGNCHYQEPIIHPTFRLNNLILSYADITLHGQGSTITKKAGEAQRLGWYFYMTIICYANWTIALITDKLTSLDQSDITTIATLPRALFPVPVISVCSTCSHFSLRTTWSWCTCHALFTFSTISAVAAWWPVMSIDSVTSGEARGSLQARVWVLCYINVQK